MWRRSSVVHIVDELARAQRRERWLLEFEALLLGLAWAVWSVRVELGLVIGLAAIQRAMGGVAGWSAVAIVITSLMAVGPSRRFVLGLLHAMHVRRAWARATIDSGVAAG